MKSVNLKYCSFFLAAVLCVSSTKLLAQSASAGAGQGGLDDPSRASATGFGNSMSSEQVRQLANYVDTVKAIKRTDVTNGPSKDEVIKRANEIINVLKLDCSVKDAALAGTSIENTSGKTFQTSLYEVACANSMGYFLNSRDQLRHNKLDAADASSSIAFTCFSAEAMRQDDLAKGTKSELYCQLPDNGNGNIDVLGGKLLAQTNTKCNVSKTSWFGVNNKEKIEFTEVSCDDGTGYLLQTALPGGAIKPTAMNCSDAARKGLECKMTPVVMPPTLATFADYLATTSVNCKVSSYDQVKVLGQESVKQRYVVEFKCAQQPNGLIAYIPLEGNSNAFETIDCVAAKKRGLNCKLNAAK